MDALARLNLTWQAVAAIALLLGFGGYLVHVYPAAVPQILGLLLGGGLALQAKPPVGPKPPEAP